MREMVAELARASRNRQEVDAWYILNNAFATTSVGTVGFDGAALCSTGHIGLDGVTRSNEPQTAIGVSQTYLQNAIIRFEDMTDERNMPRLMAPSMYLIAPKNKFAVREILGSPHKAYRADNEINALVEEDLRWMVCHYFTTADYHFLAANPGVHDINFLWRDHPIFDMFDDPWTKNAIATVYQRHTKGYGTWRGIDGSPG